jgi:flagellar motor switch protein FliM
MPATDILSQDEIDALLHGVDHGAVETDSEGGNEEVAVRPYDFTSQDRIVRGRLPTLEMINERFGRLFRASLFNLMRRSPEVAVGTVQMLKFSEYVHSLFMPANMNLVRIRPLRGTALFVLDPKLVYILVENFFGGNGRFQSKIEGRDFTAMEMRVVQLVLERIFHDLKEAWAPVLEVELEYVGSEINPHFANIVSPSEVVVATVVHVELDGGGGDLHITIPYSMIEPIRDLMDAGVQSDRSERDMRWTYALRSEVETADVDLEVTLTETTLSLGEILEMRPGDVIPVEIPPRLVARVGDVPVFWAKFGVSRGKLSLKVEQPVRQPRPMTIELEKVRLHD